MFIVFVTTSHLIVLNSQQYHFDRFTYTAKNFNVKAYQLDCKYKRSCACPGKWSFPIDSTTDYPDLRRGRALNQHSDKCIIKSSLDSFALDGHLKYKPADGRDDRKSPPELPADISQEMKAKTEELAVHHLSHPPEKIWWMVKNWADKEYARNWFGLREDQVKNLTKSSRTKLGFGNFISTVEMVPEYRQMSDTKRAFLHCSATFPHPDKTEEVMRIMIYANPSLLGLLRGIVDIYVDATFKPCAPYGFYQCLIVVVFDIQTSSCTPVVYALMSHKNKTLYN